MNDRTTASEVLYIISSVLEVEATLLTEMTTSEDVETWDSLKHLAIVLEIENRFGVNFQAEHIPYLTSVGAIVKSVNEFQSTPPVSS